MKIQVTLLLLQLARNKTADTGSTTELRYSKRSSIKQAWRLNSCPNEVMQSQEEHYSRCQKLRYVSAVAR